jgi:hypothetical protein
MSASSRPIVIAHHSLWTLYGWWLPNDPRGSTSRVIRNDLIGELGALHFGRKLVQPVERDVREFYQQAAGQLQHPLLPFEPGEFPMVAAAIGDVIGELGLTCYACAVMSDHVHLVVRKHRLLAEEMIEGIQTLSRKRLVECGLRELAHPVWTRGGWKVFLDHPDEVWRAVGYVERNPLGLGLPRQSWEFVTPYDNWPLQKGHSERSPYVRALKRAGRYSG